MRHALTIDVEEYFQVHAFSDVIPTGSWESCPSAVVENTGRILDLLDERGLTATFFCLGWIAERNPELIRSIHSRGHEVACHGYLHQVISLQGPSGFREDVTRAKGVLEDCIGEPVIGYRAPTYSITGKTLWALGILEELGFRYDSSIFPIHHDNYGIPDAPRVPHRLADSTLVEFPISTLRVGKLNLPVSGGGYFRLLPYPVTRFALKNIQREGIPFIFYIHPWELNPDTPRVREATFLSRFRTYTGIERSIAKFRRLLQDFSFTTVREVLRAYGL
ncbi:MAG: XrtA system polysaccharide deacetylase [Desulfomonilia bacterium]|jgi:polysaccharide deacetylase family protein (PEP-CTERM system associated)